MNILNLDLRKIKMYYDENQKTVRMVTVILIVALSILFFWIHGDSRTVEVEGASTETDASADSLSDEDLMDEQETGDTSVSPATAYVDISGEVRIPGVYKVTTETRLFEVIDMAGGLTKRADANSLNRAEKVTDGQKVIVRAVGEGTDQTSYGSVLSGESSSYYGSETDETGKVNINTADSDTLQTIPGIGPSKAQSIIDYREETGYFTRIEEIMSVQGIGEKTFASIKDMITV